MLWIHVVSASLALLAGVLALYARKGQATHRAAGRVFGAAMLCMTVSAMVLAAFLRPNPGNVLAASVTLYLVGTGWLTVAHAVQRPRAWLQGLLLWGTIAGLYGLVLAAVGQQEGGSALVGLPPVAAAVFGLVALAAVAGDVRVLVRGPAVGPGRLLRHLWRMGLALWIAVASFLLGQADELPAALRRSGILPVPVLLVAGTVLYWSARQAWAARRRRRAAASVPLPVA